VFSKILWIEDDPDIQTVAQMALEEIGGFTLVVCNSGAVDVIAKPFEPMTLAARVQEIWRASRG
jgi:DNA-binding response OmpR family regulator